MKIIDPVYFIVSFIIGLIYIHLTQAPPRIVIKYPTPHNAGKITYVDDAGVCYKYKMEKASCPANKKNINTVPIQQGEKREHSLAKAHHRAAAAATASIKTIPEQIADKIMNLFGIISKQMQ